jgi:cytochrome c oxidase subunit 2
MFGFSLYIHFTIYGLYTWGPLVLHTPASAHGAEVDNLMNITWILIFYSSGDNTSVIIFPFKYRGRKDRKALYFADNNKLEALWSVIPPSYWLG